MPPPPGLLQLHQALGGRPSSIGLGTGPVGTPPAPNVVRGRGPTQPPISGMDQLHQALGGGVSPIPGANDGIPSPKPTGTGPMPGQRPGTQAPTGMPPPPGPPGVTNPLTGNGHGPGATPPPTTNPFTGGPPPPGTTPGPARGPNPTPAPPPTGGGAGGTPQLGPGPTPTPTGKPNQPGGGVGLPPGGKGTTGQPGPTDGGEGAPQGGTGTPSRGKGTPPAPAPTPAPPAQGGTGQASPPVSSPAAGPAWGSVGPVELQNQGTGFVNLQNLLGANAPGADSMSNALVNQANQYGQDYQTALNGATSAYQSGGGAGPFDKTADLYGSAQKAQDYANNLKTPSGMQADLTQLYGNNGVGYSQGESLLDAMLAGQSGNPGIQQAINQYGGLVGALNSYTPPAPAAATPAQGIPPHPLGGEDRPLSDPQGAGGGPLVQNIYGPGLNPIRTPNYPGGY